MALYRRLIGLPKVGEEMFFSLGRAANGEECLVAGMLLGGELFGKAFENWLFHELRSHNAYCERIAGLVFRKLGA